MPQKKAKTEKLTFKKQLLSKSQELGIKTADIEAARDEYSNLGRVSKFNKDNLPKKGLGHPPMMYRAQVQGRCNLQFAGDKGNNEDRKKWINEWLQTDSSSTPRYQYSYEKGSDRANALSHSFTVKFPYRVFSNSGQDSIHRPVLGQYGIPYIPGSSVKGLLKRLGCSHSVAPEDREKVQTYCGNEDNPGTLRFHGAYPEGNWANQIVDVVHPQQERQVENDKSGSAFALLSFYQPTFIFEFSSSNKSVNWQDVERLVKVALQQGLGGKTSTGYGISGLPGYVNPKHSDYQSACHKSLNGIGVSSLLLNRNSEFRPNMFKATLRGHLKRLLGGVCSDERKVNQHVDYFFGSTDQEGAVKLFYQFGNKNLRAIEKKNPDDKIRRPESYSVEGTLHLSAASADDLSFIEKMLQFAYVMGGFGKSWRRVWHDTFYPNYKKFHIGCHWTSDNISTIATTEELAHFLDELYRLCCDRLHITNASSLPWREAWNRERVAVYCRKGSKSDKVTGLFHKDPFKTTLAIGGRRSPGAPTAVSSIWHRNLPLGQDAAGKDPYLEIVTLFHGDLSPWGTQLPAFIQALKQEGLQLTWGDNPK